MRLTLAFALPRIVKTRTTAFSGQISMMPKASRKVPASTSKEPAAANPAPGPMYARAGAAEAQATSGIARRMRSRWDIGEGRGERRGP